MSFASWLKKRKWIFIGLLVGAVLLSVPVPAGLTPIGMKTLALVIVAFIFFITEPIPLPGVALFIAVSEALLGLATPTTVAQSFMSDSVFFIMGSLMIATALVKQNLDKRIALAIVRITGPRVDRVMLGLVAVSALLASFIGEHTVSAMMLPVGVSLIRFTSKDQRQVRNLSIVILLSIAYGAMIAGIGTPSGGARNAIMLAYWKELFDLEMGYFSWMKIAYPIILLQIPFITYFLYRSFTPEVKDLSPAIRSMRLQVQEEGRMTQQGWITIGIFLVTVLMWMTISDKIGLGITALIGVLLFLVAGVVRWEDLNNNVSWGTILIYGGAISLGIMMKRTGVAEWLSLSLLEWLKPIGVEGGIPLLAVMSIMTILLASVMTSGPTVGLLGPIALNVASLSGTSVMAAGFVTVISSSFVYMTAVASPACNIMYGSGYLKRSDFLKAGWKLTLISFLLLLLLCGVYWSFLGLR
ncbi:MAG: DASS family sodium-coupled anion symporter [Nitrospira sp.]|nr:DASS family sodium-coupled anion symporter [Candidatus Manganitrophaceae bacterium]HIL34356.1 DASS family sodium-coupled anion symporter [Candidatus Manganitrophaceae bacterium]